MFFGQWEPIAPAIRRLLGQWEPVAQAIRRLFGPSIMHIFGAVSVLAAFEWMYDHLAITLGACAVVSWGLFAATTRMRDRGDTGLTAPSNGYSDLHNLDEPTRPKSGAPDIWYFDDGNGRVGPLNLEDLKATLATLSNPKEVSVWCNRFPDWKLAKDVPELKL